MCYEVVRTNISNLQQLPIMLREITLLQSTVSGLANLPNVGFPIASLTDDRMCQGRSSLLRLAAGTQSEAKEAHFSVRFAVWVQWYRRIASLIDIGRGTLINPAL
jgi:hypothetical protein